MKKSNDVLVDVTRYFSISTEIFIWTGTVFSLSLLFAVGGLWPEVMGVVTANLFPVFILSIFIYLYAGFCKWSLVHFESLYALRYVLVGILGVLFALILGYHYNLISFSI